MAKSIYEILDSLETETSIGSGLSYEHSLPRSMFPTGEEFESEESLLAWAKNTGCLHACLQKGIQKHLIDTRAAFKATKKGAEWNKAIGQAQVDAFTWSITERPKQGSNGKAVATARYSDCLGMIINLLEAKLDKNAIRAMAVKVYGDDTVEACFKALEHA